MRRAIATIAALILGVVVLSNTTWRKRKQERAIIDDRVSDYVSSEPVSRVDVGVRLVTVVADPNGEELLPSLPRLRPIRARSLGGIIDIKDSPIHLAQSETPRLWFCSLDQENVLFGGDPAKPGRLVNGAEGAGKTHLQALFHYQNWLRFLGEGREMGQTAPTQERLGAVKREMTSLYGRDWGKWLQRRDFSGYEFCDGTTVRFRYTHKQSEAKGSPIQSYNWSAWAGDEVQDSVDVMPDILARGRSAPNGFYRQLAAATAKDSSAWRTLRDELIASGRWERCTLLGPNTPFVWPSHWEAMRSENTEREYQRRVLAMDVPPELAVYYGWLRARNLVAEPRIAVNVTPAVLASSRVGSFLRPRSRFEILCGHDPGNIYNATEIAKCLMFGDVPTWVVVGEVWSKQTTQGEHARLLKKVLIEKFGIEFGDPGGSNAMVYCDPHGKGETQTDYQTVYAAMQREGLDVFSPAPMSGRIKRSARVGMINRLLGDANGVARLVVATDERGRPVAPHLVDALETLEKREGDDDAEGLRRKDEADKTHAPAALGYALWTFEQEFMTLQTVKMAIAEGGRLR